MFSLHVLDVLASERYIHRLKLDSGVARGGRHVECFVYPPSKRLEVIQSDSKPLCLLCATEQSQFPVNLEILASASVVFHKSGTLRLERRDLPARHEPLGYGEKESISIAKTIEAKARNMEKRLELNIRATEKAKREFEQANMELERFTTTPEN